MTKTEITSTQVREALKELKASREHPQYLKEAKVRVPRWLPKRFYKLWDGHSGEVGTVLNIEPGKYSKKLLFTVLFNGEAVLLSSASTSSENWTSLPHSCSLQRKKGFSESRNTAESSPVAIAR
ncbi:MAG: hypothetical protein JWN37_626 [Candidatus Nomurabacteria bacterium]|nr:hypothetical protein [Candidatus Nomurabacteria bacterium]